MAVFVVHSAMKVKFNLLSFLLRKYVTFSNLHFHSPHANRCMTIIEILFEYICQNTRVKLFLTKGTAEVLVLSNVS